MSYSVEHNSALADIGAAGAPVTFTLVAGTYTESTDAETSLVTTTVAGKAIRIKGTPKRFVSGQLVEAEGVMLLFCPTTYGQRPPLASMVTWEGSTRTVITVDPLAPDGTDIISRVGVA